MKLAIERMTPDEYEDGGRHLSIAFSLGHCNLGRLLLASTDKGICYIGFADPLREAFADLEMLFPNASLRQADEMLNMDTLHIKASDLQFDVWQALMNIPMGQTVSYRDIAQTIDRANAIRAVATAVGQNPIALLIPCHRVIHTDGTIGDYHWGSERKAMLLLHEQLAIQNGDSEILPLLN